jgi:hypothetical protein
MMTRPARAPHAAPASAREGVFAGAGAAVVAAAAFASSP